MAISTSNFSKHGKDYRAVSISGWPPDWYKGAQYKRLAPKWDFFQVYKQNNDEEAYTKSYYEKVLSKLDPEKVLKELDGCILLCYENENQFCHRFLVADWIEHYTGVYVPELGQNNKKEI